MKHRTSSTSAVSTRTARCRLLLIDPASKVEVARWILASRRCGGVDGGGISAGRASPSRTRGGEEEVEGGVRLGLPWHRVCCTPSPLYIGGGQGEGCAPSRSGLLGCLGGQVSLPWPLSLGIGEGARAAPPRLYKEERGLGRTPLETLAAGLPLPPPSSIL